MPSRLSLSTASRIRSATLSVVFLLLSVACKEVPGTLKKIFRSSVADFIFVGAVFFLLRAALPRSRANHLAVFVFGLATVVEFLQLSGVSSSTMLPKWLVFWIGSVFDPLDIVMYAFGTVFAVFLENAIHGSQYGTAKMNGEARSGELRSGELRSSNYQ